MLLPKGLKEDIHGKLLVEGTNLSPRDIPITILQR
jgi:hypothetical protein